MKNLCVALAVCALSGCVNAKQGSESADYIVNGTLYSAYKDYTKSVAEPRTEISFGDRHLADNCASYYKLVYQYDLDESLRNQAVRSEYLVCDALKLLHDGAAPLNKPTSKDLGFGRRLASRLDLTSFPSSLFMTADENKHTLDSLFPKSVKYHGPVAEVDTEDFRFRLEVVAIEKINDNNQPDWIVWLSDEGKSGNYRSYATLVVYDPDDKREFAAVQFPNNKR